MRALVERLRADRGTMLLLAAVIAALALYAPTLARGIVNYDDPWLVESNWLVRARSWAAVHAILFDLGRETRFTLGAEYLPVRDLSIMLDYAIWGDRFEYFHLTNLLLYLAGIYLWFNVLVGFGIDRTQAGLALLLWALLPVHAESVAWISERKGLLAIAWTGGAGAAYVRFRAGGHAAWLLAAVAASVFAVWSKAPAAFALAALAALELVLPERRRSRRRVLIGLSAMGFAALLAFIPVLLVATDTSVVTSTEDTSASSPVTALGLHGFYVRLVLMTIPNAPSYAIVATGPSALDYALGTVTTVATLAGLVRYRRWRPAVELRAAAIIWLFGIVPALRLVLPLRAVLVSDRYLLFPSLGVAFALAWCCMRLSSARLRGALVFSFCLAAGLRTLDASSNWRDSRTLWERAARSNPYDGNAWSMYAEACMDAGDSVTAAHAVHKGLKYSRSPRLLLRKALLVVQLGQPDDAERAMREAAEAGEFRAMANYASMLLDDGKLDEALRWAKRAVAAAPLYANGHRALGRVALSARRFADAVSAFERAYVLEPRNATNRLNLALGLLAIGQPTAARPLLESCVDDIRVGARARELLQSLPR